jgi:hypothetical protein
MVKVIKSAVKCYKKRTKKTVGGRKKTYEYNQYLIPLKKSDDMECSEKVFIIPQKQFSEFVGREVSDLESYLDKIGLYQKSTIQLEEELAKLEWKHNELSRSYKATVSKNAKTNKKLRLGNERIKSLETLNNELSRHFEDKEKEYQILKAEHEAELEKNRILEDELKMQKDKDIWSSLKNRLSNGGKREQEEKGK